MVFGLFTRKSTLDDPSASPRSKTNDPRLPTPTPSIASVAHHSPLRFPTVFRTVLAGSTTDTTLKDDLATDSVAEGRNDAHSPAPPPPGTPAPVASNEARALYDLVLTIPPKTLHAYTLAHLRPQPPLPSTSTSSPALGLHPDSASRPPSPNTVTKLTTFFSTLAPPPLLHCVRCHKDFYDIENEERDKACRVPHDDESALVSRVSGGDGGYETLWGCCGQTASGDGSEGPPDGWCYEGRHTTDVKRARFRADSTIHDDKLTSCLKLNCRGIRDQLPRRDSHASPSRNNVGTSSGRKSNASPARSQASVLMPYPTWKRSRKSLKEASGTENEADAESIGGRIAKAKDKKVIGSPGGGDEDASMAVDVSDPISQAKPKAKAKAKSRPISRARPPLSTSTSTTAPPYSSRPNVSPAVSIKARITAAKRKSTSHTLLSQSHVHLPSDSEELPHSRPRTRSRVREESRGRDGPRARDGLRNRTSRLTKPDISERARRARKATKQRSQTPPSEEERETETDEYQESDQEGRGRDRKRRRLMGRD